MAIFVDTSGVYAVLDDGDHRHGLAVQFWAGLAASGEELVSTSYAVVETLVLLQRRLGMNVARSCHAEVVPFLRIEWVDRSVHEVGIAMWLAADRRRLSLVDCVSFETMRRLGLDRAFAFDADFEAQGFTCLP